MLACNFIHTFFSPRSVHLFATDNLLRLEHVVPRTAFGVQKTQELLQGFGIRRIPEEGPFAAHSHEIFVLQFVEMMRERRIRYVEFRADIADH